MPAEAEDAFELIYSNVKPELFHIDNHERNTSYFPDYLKNRLTDWLNSFQGSLQPIIDNTVPFASDKEDVMFQRTSRLIDCILKTVDLHYLGQVLEATSLFNEGMEELFKGVQKSVLLATGSEFYRARSSNSGEQFEKKHLFHIPFELRHKVSTNRYSIPGFPALYLGDSTYVCWEEGNRKRLRDVSFSRFESAVPLNLIEITRFEDFNEEVTNEPQSLSQLKYLLRYVSTFPLILACTCRVKEYDANFKAEYIIPQLLLQYVTKQKDIDGIKFPSTKVDYKKIKKINAYNYVSRLNQIKQQGFVIG